MKTMKQLTYHIGLCVRAYPSNRQKKIIRKNAGVNRFVYNRLVAVNKEMQKEITPKNLLMAGPTGVGKTEIARRLADIVDAPPQIFTCICTNSSL